MRYTKGNWHKYCHYVAPDAERAKKHNKVNDAIEVAGEKLLSVLPPNSPESTLAMNALLQARYHANAALTHEAVGLLPPDVERHT